MVVRDVAETRQLCLAPVRRGRDHVGSAGRAIRRELGEELVDLAGGELPVLRLVLGRELDRHHLFDASVPEARADGEAERFPEDDELLVDGVVGDALSAANRDVMVDVGRAERGHLKRATLAARVPLEDADEMAGLPLVEGERVLVQITGEDVLLRVREQPNQDRR